MKRPHPYATAILAAIAAIPLITKLDSFRELRAAESDNAAWGAADPAWSPDGKHLAVSLFGSIWRVPAEGGIAEQLSARAGYHAHPAWSPDGNKLAYLIGSPPSGAKSVVSGTLTIIDLDSGREREHSTPHPVAGTLAWSPDGLAIVCGLSVPNAGSLLHHVPLTGASVRPLQFPPQRPRGYEWERLKLGVGPWIDAVWNPKHPELIFGAEHIGAPQIWSMPSTNPPIAIALPLTSYRQSDVMWLHGLSALPDGSGVIYSAGLQNGRGNYEIYRVPRSGGKPVAITNTVRDEVTPSVSPDGRRIAFVSNERGNTDVFVMPVEGGARQHVRITGLRFRNPSARLRLHVRDELDRPTAVRLYVETSDGKAYAPEGSPLFYNALVRGANRQGFFIAGGENSFEIPAGRLRLTALKGIEYRRSDLTIDAAAGETADVTIAMKRWTNWNQRGWYAGENHFHANYNGSYYQTPKQSLEWLEAEDLNVANMIVANKDGAVLHDREFFRGAVEPLSTARYILYWGQEYRNSDPLGHMVFLNLKTLVPPYFTSVVGSNSPYDYPLNTTAALAAKRQGGFVSYTHPMVGQTTDVFDTWLGAKEIPVVAALGGVDGIDVMPAAGHTLDLWYRLLNCGFKMVPGAGTDVFTNWRGINSIPGAARQYVETGPEMSWSRWLARYREGRVFVTNGPLLGFEINGKPMGSEIGVPAGQTYRARLSASAEAAAPLSSIEFIRNGDVIERRELDPQTLSVHFDKELSVDRSSWFAVRATGPQGALAHSSPIYVRVGPGPVLIKDDIELMLRWTDRLWAYLDERNNFGPDPNRSRAGEMFEQARRHYRAKLVTP